MPDRPMVVQFTHPGVEHRPAGPVMDWNRQPHRRKFLRATGQCLDGGSPRHGLVTLWGEWEPQSRVVETYPKGVAGGPRWLHEPWWELPRHRRLLQNTDPLVFGDHFLYSNCRQTAIPKLRALPMGSLVLFGSRLGGAFALDTVFVVGSDGQDFVRGDPHAVACPDWIQAVVFGPLRFSGERPTETFRLYRGASYLDDPSIPFSFVPCRPYTPGESAFARPALHLDPRWITPAFAQGARVRAGTHEEVREVWEQVVGQVRDADLALGVAFEPPPGTPPSSVREVDGP